MSHSRQLAAFPREVANVEGMVQRPEEEHAIRNERELVYIPQLHWVHRFHHININYNYQVSN